MQHCKGSQQTKRHRDHQTDGQHQADPAVPAKNALLRTRRQARQPQVAGGIASDTHKGQSDRAPLGIAIVRSM